LRLKVLLKNPLDTQIEKVSTMCRYCYLLFLLLLTVVRVNNGYCEEKERTLTVSATAVAGPAHEAEAKEFARRISFRSGLTAHAVDESLWYKAPPGVEAEDHVNLLQVKHGKRHDFLAFLLGKDEGTFACVARVPALEQEVPLYWFTVSPGDNEILRNAPIDRVAEFAYQLRRPAAPREVVQVEATVWEHNQQDTTDGEMITGVLETNENDLKRLLPLVVASAWEAGYQPTLAESENRFSFAFRKRADGFDVRATLTQAGKTVTCDHHGMYLENIYDELGLLCRQLGTWDRSVKAFGRLYPHAVIPLAAISRERDMVEEDVLICRANGYLLAIGNHSIEPLWQIPAGGAAARAKMNFAVQEGASKSLIGFSRASIIRIDVSNGDQNLLAKPGTDDRLSWAVDGSECAVRRETHLHFYQDGKEKWSVDCGEPLSGSPALNKDAVFVTTTLGRLICFGREDGKQRWEIPLGSACKGRLTLIKEYVYAADTTGTLHCIAANDGKIRWSISVGDLLLQPPTLVANSLLVVTGENRILVLDPVTGKAMHSRQWPTWLRSVTPLMLENKQHLFSIDIRHQLHVLTWPKLETQAEMAFPFPLESPPLALNDFATSWHGENNLLERQPTILITDDKGNVFLLEPTALAGRDQL